MSKRMYFKCKWCGNKEILFASCLQTQAENEHNLNIYKQVCEKSEYPKGCWGQGRHWYELFPDNLTADQAQTVDEIEEMNNEELLSHYGHCCQGDEYEGGYSEYNVWEVDVCKKELLKRMEKQND